MNANADLERGHNIGTTGRQFRLFSGSLFVIFGLGMTLLLAVMAVPLAMRAVVFFPMWVGILCLLQAQTGVCVFLSAKGACTVEGGTATIEDPTLRQAIEKRAARVHLLALAAGAGVTLILMLASLFIPWQSFFVAP